MTGEMIIRTTLNGFHVSEGVGPGMMPSKEWSFETAEALAKFVLNTCKATEEERDKPSAEAGA